MILEALCALSIGLYAFGPGDWLVWFGVFHITAGIAYAEFVGPVTTGSASAFPLLVVVASFGSGWGWISIGMRRKRTEEIAMVQSMVQEEEERAAVPLFDAKAEQEIADYISGISEGHWMNQKEKRKQVALELSPVDKTNLIVGRKGEEDDATETTEITMELGLSKVVW